MNAQYAMSIADDAHRAYYDGRFDAAARLYKRAANVEADRESGDTQRAARWWTYARDADRLALAQGGCKVQRRA